jgi:hypothetical protein
MIVTRCLKAFKVLIYIILIFGLIAIYNNLKSDFNLNSCNNASTCINKFYAIENDNTFEANYWKDIFLWNIGVGKKNIKIILAAYKNMKKIERVAPHYYNVPTCIQKMEKTFAQLGE